jgi:hypothetical protein
VKERYSWNFTKCCFLTVLTLLTILIFIIIFVFTEINGISRVRKCPTMWAYGLNYHVESVDVKRQSFDYGIMVDFKKFSRPSSKDKNIIEGNLQYVGKIQEIIELDYRSFKCCIFKCRWYEAFEWTQRHDTYSGLLSIDSLRFLPKDKEPYILPIHCEQVFL